ncbi:unnamed protein product [Lasius platythorax]|uniref:Fibronectin type-III domain-containing protein n=1 Tax=Lasius platythorax TaxID=488582 RepID=A0AAV2NGQ5_9HYME
MYYFKVQAYNKVGSGPYTKIINVSTTHENPVPLLLVYSSSGMQVLDMDLQINFLLNEYRTMEFAYSALERKIYWINDQLQLLTMDSNTSSIKTAKLHKNS